MIKIKVASCIRYSPSILGDRTFVDFKESNKQFVDYFIENALNETEIMLDFYRAPTELLTATFFNLFLQKLHEHSPATLLSLKECYENNNLHIITEHDFQKESMHRCIKNFRPYIENEVEVLRARVTELEEKLDAINKLSKV